MKGPERRTPTPKRAGQSRRSPERTSSPRTLPGRLEQASHAGSASPATTPQVPLDPWVVPPDTGPRRKRGRDPGRRTGNMAQPLNDLVEQFCIFQRKQRGKTVGGVATYRWNLSQYLEFVGGQRGRRACVGDLEPSTIQGWMDSMAAADLALRTMRVRQSTLSSLCAWLVKRGHLAANPVARLDRPPHRREAPRQVPGSSIMDALIKAVASAPRAFRVRVWQITSGGRRPPGRRPPPQRANVAAK
jgi:hypothetical protein